MRCPLLTATAMLIPLAAFGENSPVRLLDVEPRFESILVLYENLTSFLHDIKTDPMTALIQDESARQRRNFERDAPVDTRAYETLVQALFAKYEGRFAEILHGLQDTRFPVLTETWVPGEWKRAFFAPMPGMSLLYEHDTDFPTKSFSQSALYWHQLLSSRLAYRAHEFFRFHLNTAPPIRSSRP